MRDYGKLVWAVVGALVFCVQAGFSEGGFDATEVVGLVIAAVNAAVVWAVPDTTISKQVKAWAGGLLMGLLVLQTAVASGGISGDEWVAVLIAVLTGAGVVADPRRPVYQVEAVRPAAA